MSAKPKKRARKAKAGKPSKRSQEKRRVGRPTSYDPAMLARLIAMGKDGLTVIEMAVELGIAKSTLYKYVEDIDEFSDAFTRAREIAEAHHARNYRTQCGLPQSVFNASGYAKFMGTCFKDWREPSKIELSGADGVPLVIAWQAPNQG